LQSSDDVCAVPMMTVADVVTIDFTGVDVKDVVDVDKNVDAELDAVVAVVNVLVILFFFFTDGKPE
jgi:hypothetical protein